MEHVATIEGVMIRGYIALTDRTDMTTTTVQTVQAVIIDRTGLIAGLAHAFYNF